MAPTAVRDGRRAAIVTGGATGVGAAAAIMLARRGLRRFIEPMTTSPK